MTTEDKTALPPTQELARALFRAQADEDKTGTFQDSKAEWTAMARQTLKILEKHGYSLTKDDA